MEESKGKKDIFYLILLILTLITLAVGITFTYFALKAQEKEDSTRVQTGILSINYIDGKEIITRSLIPINEPNLNTEYYTYKKKFSVKNDGTLEQIYNIYIDVTKNEFDNNALYFALYDSNNKKISKGAIPSSGRVLLASNINLKSGETSNYTTLIWLQENDKNQNYEQGNTFVGGFYIAAEQIKYE